MEFTIRLGSPTEFKALQDIEHASDECFASVGMPEIFETGNVTAIEDLQHALNRQNLWVAADASNQPIGWAMSIPIDAGLHNEQMCVLPRCQRQGIGKTLFSARIAYARAAGFERVTVSTFLNVPWNAPTYERWGYRIMKDHELTPDLRQIQKHEIEHGLIGDKRVVMAYDLSPTTSPKTSNDDKPTGTGKEGTAI